LFDCLESESNAATHIQPATVEVPPVTSQALCYISRDVRFSDLFGDLFKWPEGRETNKLQVAGPCPGYWNWMDAVRAGWLTSIKSNAFMVAWTHS